MCLYGALSSIAFNLIYNMTTIGKTCFDLLTHLVVESVFKDRI